MMLDMSFLIRASIAISCMVFAVSANGRSAREVWDAQVASTCPSAHVEWVPFSSYSDLQAAYLGTLSRALSEEVVALAQSHSAGPCHHRNAAMQCYEFEVFEALARTGQLAPFAKWSCRHIRCQEMAVCSAFPSPK